MELTIALLKYTRGELKSCQLPVIAVQAIADGHTSKSLDILVNLPPNTRDAEKGWQSARGQIAQFFSGHQGSEIGVGRSLDVSDKDMGELTAYIPDADGTVRPGAY